MQVYPSGSGDLGERRTRSRRMNNTLGKKSLTEKQFRVFYFIVSHIEKVGLPPSVREIADHFSISIKAAHDYLKSLSKKEYIRLFSGTARGLEILKKDLSEFSEFLQTNDLELIKIQDKGVYVPLLNTNLTTPSITNKENISCLILLSQHMIPQQSDNYVTYKVNDNSMQNAGFIEGDLLILKTIQSLAEVAMNSLVGIIHNNTVMIRKYSQEVKGELHLLADSKDIYAPIVMKNTEVNFIFGIVVGSYRIY